MDGMLFEALESVSTAANFAPLVTRLLAEVDQLRAEVAGLRRENLELITATCLSGRISSTCLKRNGSARTVACR
jgi:hypothetical protein